MKRKAKLEELQRLFEAYEKLTVKEIASYTNLAPRTIRDYLKVLQNENLIVAVGATNKRYYKRNYAVDEEPIIVSVLQNSTEVGTISFTYAKGYRFSYSLAYTGKRIPGLEDSTNHAYALFPVFENLIPESTRRERLLLKDGKMLNPLELLLELNNTHGSFDFKALKTDTKVQNEPKKIPVWKSIKKNILENNSYVNLLDYEIDIPKEILKGSTKQRELYSSLSGYQHKIDVNIDHKNRVIKRADKQKGELANYLLKPYAGDAKIINTPYLALNEHLFMSFAKNILKLDVPYSAVLLGENRDFYLLVKRYDRYLGYKYHQYDFAQLLNIESEDKYDITLLSILEKFSTIVHDKKSKEDVFIFMIYASLIKHGDFHAKNIGVIAAAPERWELAPLYDIISTYIYEGKNGDDFGIAFSIENPKKRKLRYNDYIQMANVLQIKPARAKILIKNTIKRFQVYLPHYIQKTEAFEESLQYPPKLSKKLHSLYNEKNIELDKLGIFKEIGLKRTNL